MGVAGFSVSSPAGFLMSLDSDVTEALASYPVRVLNTAIGQRVAFAESAGQGSTVLDLDPNSAASREIMALTREILEIAA